MEQDPPPPTPADAAERAELAERIRGQLRELDEIEAQIEEMKRGHQVH